MRRRSFAGNSAMTLAAQLAVAAAAFVSLPVIVRGLGPEAFGLLSLLWMFIGYVTVFDLGVGQAAAKFVTEELRAGDRNAAVGVLHSALRAAGVLGAAGGMLVLLLAVAGPSRVFDLAPPLEAPAVTALMLLVVGVPATLLSATLKSVPIAFDRFDVLNVLQLVVGLVQWVGGAVAVALGGGVVGVVAVTVVGRVMVLGAFAAYSLRVLPELRHRVEDRTAARERLWRFGSWAAVSQIVPPALLLLERLIVGTVLSLSALAFFAVPSEIMVRLLLFPASLAVALFPVVSGGWRNLEGRISARRAYRRSVRIVVLVLVPLAAVLAIYSREILTVWLGGDFPAESGPVLALMAFGVIFNAVAQLPVAVLQGSGKPEAVARVQLAVVPLYAVLLYALTVTAGIMGAAAAWVVKVAVEGVALTLAARRLFRDVPTAAIPPRHRAAAPVAAVSAAILLAGKAAAAGPVVSLSTAALAGLIYAAGAWKLLLDDGERQVMRGLFGRPSGTPSGSPQHPESNN